MHILYLHQHFVTRSGTSGGRSHEFSRILVERGHRVTLITGAYDRGGLEIPSGRRVWRTRVDGIDVIVIRIPYGQEMSVPTRIRSFLQFMVLAMAVGTSVDDVDVVFATSTPLTIAVPGMVLSAFHRKPFVFEVRDLWPEVPIEMGILRNPLVQAAARWLERTAYRRARHIVALSPGMRDGILTSGVAPGKVTVIPNSSDVELFRVDPEVGKAFRAAHPEWGDGPVVVYAGAFGRVNGLDYVVELAGCMANLFQGTRFVLAGDGSERNRVQEMASAAGILDRNFFLIPSLPRSELPGLLSAAAMVSSFVAPLRVFEMNSANKFFDAFAAGKPVVINYGGWQAELLERTGAGLVLDPMDPKGSAERLARALRDRAWLQRASEASRRLGDENFNRRRLALELEEVLVEAAE